MLGGEFPHECGMAGCKNIVRFDDERYCYSHSDDSGSHEPGYSARREAELEAEGIIPF